MIEDRLAEIASSGWRVNNLFEVAGHWQANLRNDDSWFTEYAQGETAEDALIACMLKIAEATHHPKSETKVFSGVLQEKVNLATLFAPKVISDDRRD